MTAAALTLGALLLVPVVHDLLRRPLVRRLGLGHVRNRAGEAAAVVGGAALATALITTAFVVGDSFGASVEDLAVDGLGPVDESIAVPSDRSVDEVADEVTAILGLDEPDGVVDGVLATGSGRLSLVAPSTGAVRPGERFMVADIEALGSFGGDRSATGFGDVAADSDIVISSVLAEDLDVSVGDLVTIPLGERDVDTAVDAVVEPRGMANFVPVVVSTDWFADQIGDPAANGAEMAVLVSNRGDARTGVSLTEEVERRLEGEPALAQLTVEPLKADLLEAAEADRQEFTTLFGTLAGFSVAAGILLAVNLFIMLVGDRRREIGIGRAVGLARGTIVRAQLVEGSVYSILAAATGVIGGIGIGALIVTVIGERLGDDVVSLRLAVEGGSLLSGGVLGFTVSQLTTTVTVLALSRVPLIAALRDLPNDRHADHPWRRAVAGLAVVTAGVASWVGAGDAGVVLIAAPLLVLLGAAIALRRAVPAIVPIVALAALVWPFAVFEVASGTLAGADVHHFLLQGLIVVAAATVLAASARPVWIAVARMAGNRVGLRLGVAHASARPARTSLLMAMYAIVVFTLAFLASMASTYGRSGPILVDQAAGSYRVIAEPGLSAPGSDRFAAVDGVAAATPTQLVWASMTPGAVEISDTDEASGGTAAVTLIEDSFGSGGAPALIDRAESLPSDEAAWAAVAASASAGRPAVIAGDWVGVEVGEVVSFDTRGGGRIEADVVGVVNHSWLLGTELFAPTGLAATLDASPGRARTFLALEDDADLERVVADVEDAAPGARLRVLPELAEEELAEQAVFLDMLQAYLAMGLVVGIAGLGVVLARAVRERRREFAMLDAMGFERSRLISTIAVEGLFVAVHGVVIGAGLGLISAWQSFTRTSTFDEGLEFVTPARALLLVGAVCLVASVAAGGVAVARVLRLRPAAVLSGVT